MDKFEYSLTTYLNGINLKQGNIQDDERAMKKYPKFVINKCMSDYIDCIMYSNEMNRYYDLDNDLQYNFCLLYTSPSPRDNTTSRMPSSA